MNSRAGLVSGRGVDEPGRRAFDELFAELIEAAAERAAEIVLAELPTSTPTSELLSIPEAAELLRCRRQRVDDLLSSGRLRRVKDGRRTLVRRSDVLAYLAGGG